MVGGGREVGTGVSASVPIARPLVFSWSRSVGENRVVVARNCFSCSSTWWRSGESKALVSSKPISADSL